VKIVSLNVWGGALREELLAYLVAADADVLCLQEVPRTAPGTPEWLTYRDGAVELAQRANLYDELRSVLPQHDGFFCPTARGELFDGDTPYWQEFGLATFVRSSIAVIGHTMRFIRATFNPHGFGPHPRPRNAHAIRLYDYTQDRSTTIVQLHGLRVASGKGDTPERDAQVHALHQLIRDTHAPGEPLIVCGDLNVLPDSRLFDTLAGLGLTDLVTTHGFTDTRTSRYTKPGRYADYLLVTPEVDVIEFDVVEQPEVSDHRPLALTTL